jgi:S-phase kinase-associated protein 1
MGSFVKKVAPLFSQTKTMSIVRLQSSDGDVYPIGRDAAAVSVTLDNMLTDVDGDDDTPIPVEATSATLQKVIEFCTRHAGRPPLSAEQEEALRRTPIAGDDKTFVAGSLDSLFDLIKAANFFDIAPMLNLTCKAVAEMIRGACARTHARAQRVRALIPRQFVAVLRARARVQRVR